MKSTENKFTLLKEISSLHFMAVDLNLFLDTHPLDTEALAKYNSVIMQLTMLKQDYTMHYGMLSPASCSPYPFNWISEPWPWEYDANYKLCVEER
jgi:spore coat protein JB